MIGERNFMSIRSLEEKKVESGRAKNLSKHMYMKKKHGKSKRKTMND